MQLLFLLFSSYFASLFCLYLNTRYADLKVPFDMMGHILSPTSHINNWYICGFVCLIVCLFVSFFFLFLFCLLFFIWYIYFIIFYKPGNEGRVI